MIYIDSHTQVYTPVWIVLGAPSVGKGIWISVNSFTGDVGEMQVGTLYGGFI